MQLDMHYYSVFYLSLAAGFEPEDAYIIAYSSQYVDDARENQPIQLTDENREVKTLDPICTQHMSLQAFSETISDKVYFPFHFIPIGKGDSPDERVITRPFEENQLHLETFMKARSTHDLYRLGIGLHALADSYSHQYFSGEWSTVNEVRRMRCVLRRRVMPSNVIQSLFIVIWEYLKRFGQWVLSCCAPEIGHIKAYKVPDYPHAVWRFKDYNNHPIKRSNPDSFNRCGMVMYKHLKRACRRGVSPLNEMEVKKVIQKAVYTTGSMKNRVEYWEKAILNLVDNSEFEKDVKKHLEYDPIEWKQMAIAEDITDIKVLNPRDDRPYPIIGLFNQFKQSHYFKYLTAAREQRICVLEALKEFLPRVELSLEETKGKIILS